jgi:hypothetical protein
MTGADITRARAQLARLWGLKRPLTASQLGRILQLDGRDPGQTVRRWETGAYDPPGPVRLAVALMLAGARPEGAPSPATVAAAEAPSAGPGDCAPDGNAPQSRSPKSRRRG